MLPSNTRRTYGFKAIDQLVPQTYVGQMICFPRLLGFSMVYTVNVHELRPTDIYIYIYTHTETVLVVFVSILYVFLEEGPFWNVRPIFEPVKNHGFLSAILPPQWFGGDLNLLERQHHQVKRWVPSAKIWCFQQGESDLYQQNLRC